MANELGEKDIGQEIVRSNVQTIYIHIVCTFIISI